MPPDARPHEQSTPPPQITLQQLSGDTAIVTLSGDHDLATRPRLAAALEAARGQKNLIVDLTPCTFVDSTIIGVLLSAYVTSQLATAQRLEVVGPPPAATSAAPSRLPASERRSTCTRPSQRHVLPSIPIHWPDNEGAGAEQSLDHGTGSPAHLRCAGGVRMRVQLRLDRASPG